MLVNRLEERQESETKADKNHYLSIYEVVEKISEEVINTNRDLVNNVTLKKAPIAALENSIIKIINRYNYRVVNMGRNALVKEVMDSIFGYSIMQKYLDNPGCNGLFINSPSNVWIQIGKDRTQLKESFGNDENLISYIRTIQAKLGGEINENNPIVKFSDPINRLRIVCGIPPVAVNPFVVFRKQPDKYYTLKDLVHLGMLSKELAEDLDEYNRAGANIVFCGRGGAGKTTLMGALINRVPKNERILLMQEQVEIEPEHPNVIPTVVKRNELGNVIDLKKITDIGLLMSIERYVFGEIRGSEALPLFKGAMSGNIMSVTTHSSGTRDVIDMLMINMKLDGTDINSEVLKEILFKSINIIVYADSFVATEVVEIVKENSKEEDKFNDLWTFDVKRRETTFIEGTHRKVGVIESLAMKKKLDFIKKANHTQPLQKRVEIIKERELKNA